MSAATPTEREALNRVLSELKTEMHTAFPARVLAYDLTRQTLDLRPAVLREVPSDDPASPWGYESLPDLYDVQIMWPRAGGFVITFPIQVGDWVLVTCAEQATMNWRTKAEAPSHPGVSDPFGLNGLVAQPGWVPDKEKATNVSASRFVIGKPDGTAILQLDSSGNVYLGNGTGHRKLADEDWVKSELEAVRLTLESLTGGSSAPAEFGVAYTGPGDANTTKTRGL